MRHLSSPVPLHVTALTTTEIINIITVLLSVLIYFVLGNLVLKQTSTFGIWECYLKPSIRYAAHIYFLKAQCAKNAHIGME